MPPRRRPLPPHLTGSYFTSSQALEAGVTERRLRQPDLVIQSQGIRRRADRDSDPWDHLKALQQLHPRGVFTHYTAATIWGIWLPLGVSGDDPVHLSKVRRDGGMLRRGGVAGHVLSENALVKRFREVRVTHPAWTWIDLAGVLGFEDLVAAGDSLLQRSDGPAGERHPGLHPLTGLQEIGRVLCLRPKVRGIVQARAALEQLRVGVDSAKESNLRLRIVEAGFPEPSVNPTITLSSGPVSPPDLAWEELKICIQYEGDHHRTDKSQWRRDIARDRRYAQDGWIVLRVTGDVFTPSGWNQFITDLTAAFAQARGGQDPS